MEVQFKAYLEGTFSITLILVRDYFSCRIQKYLNRNFHSNPTLLHSRFRYFTVDYLYFFSNEVETATCFF